MAIVVEQTIQYDDPAGASATHQKTGISTTAGRRLILAIMDGSTGATANVTGVTDSAGNTWTQVVRANNAAGFAGASIWATGTNASAITSFTITTAAAFAILSQFYEVSGTGTADVNTGTTGTGTAVSSGSSGTPTGTADLVVAVGGAGLTFSISATSAGAFTTAGGTFVNHESTPTSFQTTATTGRNILAAATAQTFTCTLTNSEGWAAVIALWQPAAGAAALSPRPVSVRQAVQRAAVR